MMSQTVVCSCHTGYRLLMDGRSCVAIRCTDPGTPQHGQRSVNGLEVGGEIQFECLAGYRLTGNNVVRCTADGTWNSENPTCEAIRCTDPGTPQHGRRSVSGLEVDGEVQFECMAGYRLTGNNVVRCTTDGTWSSENPTCEDINECTSGTARCNPETSTCVNTVGSYNCVCMPGYEQDGVGGCRDIDECQRGLDRCDPLTQDCVNTPGSYQCRCKDGYKLTADKESCEKLEDKIVVRQDINECDGNDHGCDMENGGCQDTLTSYYCYCNSGYERSDTNLGTTVCVDIDECQTRTDSCDRLYGSCRNTPGSYTCSCNTGFELAANNRNCRDINECERGLDTCDPLVESCENTMGSYRCVCMEGYQKNNNGVCEDIDECRENIAKCELLKQDCENTRGSYRCVCRQGQKLSKDGKFCEDEALQCPQPRILNGAYFYVAGANKDVYTAGDRVSYTCDDGYEITGASLSTCLETGEWDPVVPKCLGVLCPEPEIVEFSTRRDSGTIFRYQDTASLQCFAGYVMDGPERITCRANGAWTTYPTCSACPKDSYADNNQCKRCPANSHTISDASSSITSCICDRGYTGPPGGPCQEVILVHQEDLAKVGVRCIANSHTMSDASSSITSCICDRGYTGPPGEPCQDENECSAVASVCGRQQCRNTVGSYNCYCDPGYSMDNDRQTCQDLDECQLGTHTCDQICNNTPGGYTCSCQDGYSLVNNKCEDINECDQSGTCDPRATCQNLLGSYKCTCMKGFVASGSACVGKYTCMKGFVASGSACVGKCTCMKGFVASGSVCVETIPQHLRLYKKNHPKIGIQQIVGKLRPQREKEKETNWQLSYLCKAYRKNNPKVTVLVVEEAISEALKYYPKMQGGPKYKIRLKKRIIGFLMLRARPSPILKVKARAGQEDSARADQNPVQTEDQERIQEIRPKKRIIRPLMVRTDEVYDRNQDWIECEDCLQWFHVKCEGIQSSALENLQHTLAVLQLLLGWYSIEL
ncbi:fibrillin-1-like [Lingula anatina]|uniref:Fibrillin-1-like n=1 Tax=Lingula anatina TaxID=7574 RepID=A0A2R2MKP5_LINAN|nr:fibrillin-1-like [Lingula anatina]|eukprot:XP_023930780.1 fibrillin-1-like [Lingula anatina]